MNWLQRMAGRLTRDKADTLLLIVAAMSVLLPHAAHLPAWIPAVCAAALLWRGLVTFLGTRMPPTLLLLPIALASMAGVFSVYHTFLGRDAGVAMLVLLVTFKMLEMHARRDLFVVIFLCFFIVLTNFFYSQSIGTAVLMVGSVILLFAAQLSFQFTGAVPPLARRLRMSAAILVFAAPAALMMFYLFPRIQGPLWGMPGDSGSGRSGLSETMAPGNLSSLAQSDEVAFRVKFADQRPPQEQLYWRAIVLGTFDGRTWSRLHTVFGRPEVAMQVSGEPVRHTITLEPSSSRWVFALDVPGAVPYISGNPVSASPDLELAAQQPFAQRTRYTAESYPHYTLDAGQRAIAHLWMAIPYFTNPRTQQLAQALSRDPVPERRVAAVLQRFRNEPFVYTLEPPLLGRDTIDEFLFTTRAGFCEHYAGAFVFLMRAAGVPARVVTGYQGGEFNPVDGFVTVRQSDAHAWAEVWLGDRGWVRVDPTAAVAPERIQRGLARAVPSSAPFGFAGLIDLANDRNSWLGQLRLRLAAINNGWNQWVLDYTPERQRGFLDTLDGMFANLRTVAGAGAVLLMLALLRKVRQRARRDPVDTLYSALCAQLARRGWPREAHEGPNAYALRLQEKGAGPEVARLLAMVSDYRYGVPKPDEGRIAEMKQLMNAL